MQAVIHDKAMLAQLDILLQGAAEILDYAREKMDSPAGTMALDDIDSVLALRDEMAMRLARYDQPDRPNALDPARGSAGIQDRDFRGNLERMD